jgi:hypothetical protein
VAQLVNVFIASPSDVRPERDCADAAVQRVSERTSQSLDIALQTVRWENFLPSATREDGERVQDRFTSLVRKCGIFIGILDRRYGTSIDESRKTSGTEEEFDAALEKRRHVEILTYFRRQPASISNNSFLIAQAYKLQELKNKLKDSNILVHNYDSPEDFGRRIVLDLFDAVIRISIEAERRAQFRAFFQFGIASKHQSPSVLLGYPAIHRHATHRSSLVAEEAKAFLKSNWQERLLPNVVYEDFKAIQKIEAAVHLSGVENISSVTLDSPKLQASPGNRIWLCMPRNELAQSQLNGLAHRPRFRFEKAPEDARPYIRWRSSEGKLFNVRSPLALYLNRQKRPKLSYWSRELGQIVARDYAVISRFSLPETRHLTRVDPFFHYFIAGIRGLGTWGAAWYIDRRPDELERIVKAAGREAPDIQVLIEVTFSNHRIVAVSDVSSEPPEHFENQLSTSVIDATIDLFRY